MALAEEWADGAVGGLGQPRLAAVEPDERFVVAPVGYRTEVPVDGGGQPGWGLEARPPGTCERRSADWAEPGLSHLVLDRGARVDDPDESVAMVFHRCSFCRTALISVGVSASRADERRWYELVEGTIQSEGPDPDALREYVDHCLRSGVPPQWCLACGIWTGGRPCRCSLMQPQ